MPKDIIIPHKNIDSPEKVTEGTRKAIRDAELNIHRHEVDRIEDDFDKKERRLKIKTPRTFFFQGKNTC